MGAKLNGATEFKRVLATFKRNFPDEVGAALYAETQIEATEVKKRTPVWNSDRKVPKGVTPGALRASVRALKPMREGSRIFTRIAAGGASAPYAVYVHEDLDAFHKVGQAKYLESVLLENRAYMAARVAKRISLRRAATGESAPTSQG